MSDPSPAVPLARPRLDPTLLGTACCVGSALCYTAANICLRQLAGWHLHPAWVIAVKEIVTVAVVGPFLLWLVWRRGFEIFDAKTLAVLVVTGIGVQLAGNMSVQWAFGAVGLTVSTPTAMGVMLVASGVFGLLCFGERITFQSALAIGFLIVAISLLATGTWVNQQAARASAENLIQTGQVLPSGLPSLGLAIRGVGAAALGGTMFAALAVAVRYAGGRNAPISLIVFVITGMGVICCGLLSLTQIGLEGMAATTPTQFGWMLASGVFNLLAFLLITKGLQLTTLVHANLINASQVALAAVAGMLLFQEPSNLWLFAGVILTIVGIYQIGRPTGSEEVMEPV